MEPRYTDRDDSDRAPISIVWQPQPGPQTWLLTCPVFEVFFGGARGGGKTDGMLGEWVSHAAQYAHNAVGLMVRRTRVELRETIERSNQLYFPLGAQFNTQDKMWRFPNGARLTFAYLESDDDAQHYQGHSYTRVYVEEIGNFPHEEPVLKLMATLRSGAGVPVGFRATGNPGSVGHQWVKARYIDHAPAGLVVTNHEYTSPIDGRTVSRDRVFIPSRLSDNKILTDADPNYVANLQMQGSPELVRAWLEGDWSVVAGTAFEKLSRAQHMMRPFKIPEHWTKFTALDWGTAKPYSVGWYTVPEDDLLIKGRNGAPDKVIARGSIIRYRELYGWNGKPDTGRRQEAREVAHEIAQLEWDDEKEKYEPIDYRIADSAMWAEHDGPSAAENMMKEFSIIGVSSPSMEKSRKDRAANYLEIRNRIANSDDENAGFYVFDDCVHFWRTVPELQLDARNPEKGWDTQQEDHVIDEVAYALVSRPVIITKRYREEAMYEKMQAKARKADKGYVSSSYYS